MEWFLHTTTTTTTTIASRNARNTSLTLTHMCHTPIHTHTTHECLARLYSVRASLTSNAIYKCTKFEYQPMQRNCDVYIGVHSGVLYCGSRAVPLKLKKKKIKIYRNQIGGFSLSIAADTNEKHYRTRFEFI